MFGSYKKTKLSLNYPLALKQNKIKHFLE